MNNLPLLLLSIFAIASCIENGDPADPMIGVDSDPLVVCDCELPTAVDVSYDNTSSELVATEVQGAISELAARQAPDFADRLVFVETEGSDTPSTSLLVLAGCNSGQADHIVLGGGCKTDDPNVTLVDSRIVPGLGFRCEWKKSGGVPATGTAQVTCVAPAP